MPTRSWNIFRMLGAMLTRKHVSYLCTVSARLFVRHNSTIGPTRLIHFLIFSFVLLRGERGKACGQISSRKVGRSFARGDRNAGGRRTGRSSHRLGQGDGGAYRRRWPLGAGSGGCRRRRQEAERSLEGLLAAKEYIRHELVERLRRRRAPELHFRLDHSDREKARVEELLARAKKRMKQQSKAREEKR